MPQWNLTSLFFLFFFFVNLNSYQNKSYSTRNHDMKSCTQKNHQRKRWMSFLLMLILRKYLYASETPRDAVIISKSRSVLQKKTSFLSPRNSKWHLVMNPEKAKENRCKNNILENHWTSSASTKGKGKIYDKINTMKSLDSILNVKQLYAEH